MEPFAEAGGWQRRVTNRDRGPASELKPEA
jgi:hypothetical protein